MGRTCSCQPAPCACTCTSTHSRVHNNTRQLNWGSRCDALRACCIANTLTPTTRSLPTFCKCKMNGVSRPLHHLPHLPSKWAVHNAPSQPSKSIQCKTKREARWSAVERDARFVSRLAGNQYPARPPALPCPSRSLPRHCLQGRQPNPWRAGSQAYNVQWPVECAVQTTGV